MKKTIAAILILIWLGVLSISAVKVIEAHREAASWEFLALHNAERANHWFEKYYDEKADNAALRVMLTHGPFDRAASPREANP